MKTSVQIGGVGDVQLRSVIGIYAPDILSPETVPAPGSVYATECATTVEDGAVHYGPERAVTMEFVQVLAAGLGVQLAREVLPAGVICRTQEVIAWWSPPAVRTLFFADTHPLARLNGEDFPVPGLVWRLELKDRKLFLRATAGRERPEARSRMYVAPFLNVYDDDQFGRGLVCQGTMRRPKTAGVESLREWESGFFGASGTQQLATQATLHPRQLAGLWGALKRRKSFPDRYLLPTGQNLAQFLGVR